MQATVLSHLHLDLLSCPDSNQDKQDQNLLCYHYTTGQLKRKITKFLRINISRIKIYAYIYISYYFFNYLKV